MQVAWIGVALLAGGCLFRNIVEPRYFRPESLALDGAEAAPHEPDGAASPVCPRPVQGTSLLRERIVWRASAVEYGRYAERRWTELPATLVQRALQNMLRRTPGLHLTDAPGSPTLRVVVVSFDEILAPSHDASVSLAVSLGDREQRPLLDRTFSALEPIAGGAPAETATAMGKALDDVVGEVARAVGDALQAR